MYNDLFAELGLSKNEGRIYETLLEHGESSAGVIAGRTLIHRRNVYDTLKRLEEKGLVFEVLDSKESLFKAVDPEKLLSLLNEKEERLRKAMPSLQKLYGDNPDEERVAMYRGVEGYKAYLRDVLLVGKELKIFGATGASADKKIASIFDQFKREAKRKNIKVKILYRPDILEKEEFIGHMGDIAEYKILPKDEKLKFPTGCAIYGSHVYLLSSTGEAGILPENLTHVFIINSRIAETFSSWFDISWNTLPEYKLKNK